MVDTQRDPYSRVQHLIQRDHSYSRVQHLIQRDPYSRVHVGFHVFHGQSLADQCIKACELIGGFGFTPYLQFFVCNPQSHKFVNITDEEKTVIKGIPHKVIHSSYVSNPWGKAKGSLHNLKKEMRLCSELRASGCIIHMGKGINNDEILHYVLNHISALCKELLESSGHGIRLWLEINSALCSDNTFETPDKLNKLISRLFAYDVNIDKYVGICIDSAHVFACGMSLDTAETTRKWLDALDKRLPIMFHLNDSLGICGDGRDIHAEIFKGNIWKDYGSYGKYPASDSGCYEILKFATKNKCPVILERHMDDNHVPGELTKIYELMT